jgi:hypothetical protein
MGLTLCVAQVFDFPYYTYLLHPLRIYTLGVGTPFAQSEDVGTPFTYLHP